MTLLAPSLQAYFTTYAHDQRDLSPNTIASYRDAWKLLIKHIAATQHVTASTITWEMINPQVVAQFLQQCDLRGNTPKTRNQRLTAIRALAAYAAPDHPEHANTLARVLALPAKRTGRGAPQFLDQPEVDALLTAPNTDTWTGRRDQALLTLAAQSGLRISELTSLQTCDIQLTRPATVRCTGKGRKHRTTPLTVATVAIMSPYLAERVTRPGTALFPNPHGDQLSRDAVEHRLAIYVATAAEQAPSIGAKHVTMHTLRHTAAMRLLEAGVDVSVIALWLGHEHTTSTDIYLHADMTLKQAAIDRTRPPNVAPGAYRPAPDILDWLQAL
jgi:site-specific recombinase XerD